MSYKSLERDENRGCREAYKSLEPEDRNVCKDSCREDSFSEIRGTCTKGSSERREYLISSSDSDDMESCG